MPDFEKERETFPYPNENNSYEDKNKVKKNNKLITEKCLNL